MKRIQTYQEFWPYYLSQHSKTITKRTHAIGLFFGIVFAVGVCVLKRPALLPLSLVVSYSFAWFSHFVFEGNKPATFDYPVWSLISEFRMVWLFVLGRL